MLFKSLLIGAALVDLSIAGYVLQDDYSPNNFFDMFDFFTGRDPTNGYVTYVDRGTAQNTGLISNNNGRAYMGVDHTNIASGSGRASVRLTSKKSYNHGLIIVDFAHVPGSVCGSWPAFWMVGPNWPNGGEIDIIEGVNQQNTNAMTLHTSAGCSITNNGAFSGSIVTPNCDVNAPDQGNNVGCSINTGQTNTYGDGFNAVGGGVYATLWNSDAISVYFFPRNQIPGDINNGNPNPGAWGRPLAQFQGGCNIDAHFQNLQIVLDTTFCGDWAGNVWNSGSCASRAPTCNSFVQNNPGAFAESFWSVNSLKVYQFSAGVNWESITESSSVAEPIASSVVVSASSSSSSSSIAAEPLTSAVQASPSPTAADTTITAIVTVTSPTKAEKTVSALRWDQFPSTGETQTQGIKPRSAKLRHGRHLLQHRKRAAGADVLV
ncbi:hypothetical protein MMC16_000361 [Acarospora aff. strigata]|nr:hypothetical protein [Acarospora aff. strigata]